MAIYLIEDNITIWAEKYDSSSFPDNITSICHLPANTWLILNMNTSHKLLIGTATRNTKKLATLIPKGLYKSHFDVAPVTLPLKEWIARLFQQIKHEQIYIEIIDSNTLRCLTSLL